ncbi:MAG: PAS domain S-box protein [Gemmatimonadaceae bacterium]
MTTNPTLADYRVMVESAPEAIIVYTPEMFLFLNEFAARRLGSDPATLVGRPIMEFVHPESVPVVIARLRQLAETGQPNAPIEIRFVSIDGAEIPAEVVSVPIVFAGRNAILGLIRDVSRRAEAERALRESEERFANAFRYSPHGMAFVGLDGRWLRANQSLCDMLGYTEEELRAISFQTITHPDDLNADLEELSRLGSGEISNYQRVKRYYRKDGSLIWVSLAISSIHDAEGKPIYFVEQIQDVTRQREMEAENARAQRLAGVAETTVAVAHEMNNVLTALQMNAELLATDARQEEIPEIAAEILLASTRISAIVQRLRNIGDAQSVEYLGGQRMLDLSPKPARKTPNSSK